MRWYRKWYNDGWQEVDEDHIRDTDCTDPYDGKEHNIAKVSRYFLGKTCVFVYNWLTILYWLLKTL